MNVLLSPIVNLALRKLLTDTPAGDGSVLFENAAELGRRIAGLPEGHYKNKEASAISFVTQVFRRSRSCPIELAEAIFQAVRARLREESKVVQDDWVQRVSRAIDFGNQELRNSKKEAKQSLSHEELFDEIIQRAREADDQFIITSRTAEQSQAPGRGGALRDILIERIGLFKAQAKNTAKPNPPTAAEKISSTRYIFLLPNDAAAIAFWKNLFKRIVFKNPMEGGNLEIDEASEKLAKAYEAELLRVYVVEQAAICGCPIVVFDVDRYASAYSFCFDETNRPRVIKWDSITLGLWRNNVALTFDAIRKTPFGWDRMLQDQEIKKLIESYQALKK